MNSIPPQVQPEKTVVPAGQQPPQVQPEKTVVPAGQQPPQVQPEKTVVPAAQQTEAEVTDRPLDPPKLLRMAALVREVLDEVRKMEPSPTTATQMAELYGRVKTQLTDALPEFLASELDAIQLDLPLRDDDITTDEVRMAYAGLIGWLGGLFQGLQASFQAHQQMQLAQMQQAQQELARQSEGVLPRKEGYL
jgi:hypothetical protein